MTATAERAVVARRVATPHLEVQCPGGELRPCELIQIDAETQKGVATGYYFAARFSTYWLLFRLGVNADPYTVRVYRDQAVECDCPDWTMRPERRPCKHCVAVNELLSA